MKDFIKKLTGKKNFSVFIAVLVLCIVFAIASPNFISAYNIYNLSRTAALYVFIALSQAMVIIVGGMNLSIGYIGALSVITVGHVLQNLGWGAIPAAALGIIVGLLAGFVNGILINKLKLSSFVVTLATSFIYKGLVTGISQGFPYTDIPDSFTVLGRGKFLGLPLMLYLAIAVLFVVWYFFKYTVSGRKMLATGGNATAARMAAIDTEKSIMLANVLCGLFAAIAAICSVSMSCSAQPSTGADWMIYSFAVAVIGGTALVGGEIRAPGIIIAAFLIVMIKNGLVMINANYYYEQTYLGLILLFAVSISTVSNMVKARKEREAFLRNREKKAAEAAK